MINAYFSSRHMLKMYHLFYFVESKLRGSSVCVYVCRMRLETLEESMIQSHFVPS